MSMTLQLRSAFLEDVLFLCLVNGSHKVSVFSIPEISAENTLSVSF